MRPERLVYNYSELIQEDRIHSSLYTDPIFQWECKIFYEGWVFVGHASEIPNPGDYVRRLIGLEPIYLYARKMVRWTLLSIAAPIAVICSVMKKKAIPKPFLAFIMAGFSISMARFWMYHPQKFFKTIFRSCFGQSSANGFLSWLLLRHFQSQCHAFWNVLGTRFSLIDRACEISPAVKSTLLPAGLNSNSEPTGKCCRKTTPTAIMLTLYIFPL